MRPLTLTRNCRLPPSGPRDEGRAWAAGVVVDLSSSWLRIVQLSGEVGTGGIRGLVRRDRAASVLDRATQDGTEEQVVVLRRPPLQSQVRCNLRPVADLMSKNVQNDPSR